MDSDQRTLPGLAPNPHELEPLRPSYTKLFRRLAAAVAVEL